MNSNRINKFQRFLDNGGTPYTSRKRTSLAVPLSARYLNDTIIPAISAGAKRQVTQRIEAIKKRGGENHVVEALFDPHFRKQRNYGPSKAAVAAKVEEAYRRREPISLVGLMFTRKNICPLKRDIGDESTVDMAEILSFTHLNAWCQLIAAFYPYGVEFHILSEGRRFKDAFELCMPAVHLYQKRIRSWIEKLTLSHIKFQDYEEFIAQHMTPQQVSRRRRIHAETREEYRRLMLPILNIDSMEETLKRASELDPIKDPDNPRNNFVPLWESIKNSLPYPALQEYARSIGEEYDHFYARFFRNLLEKKSNPAEERLREYVIRTSWSAAIAHNTVMLGDRRMGDIESEALISPTAFRTTINPKPGSAQLGIYAARETTHRIQPWHGLAYLYPDTAGRIVHTILSKVHIESMGGIPIYVDGAAPWCLCYTDQEVANMFARKYDPTFNMATRI